MLEIDVLEHRLDHEIDVAESRVFGRRAGEGHHVGEFLTRDLLFHIALLHDLADRGQPLADARRVGVLEPHEGPVLHSHRGDSGSHEARAEHAELLDGVRRRCRDGNAGVLL